MKKRTRNLLKERTKELEKKKDQLFYNANKFKIEAQDKLFLRREKQKIELEFASIRFKQISEIIQQARQSKNREREKFFMRELGIIERNFNIISENLRNTEKELTNLIKKSKR